MRELLLNEIDCVVANFLYYDRRKDEELGLNEMKGAIRRGEITIEEITNHFALRLSQGLDYL